MDVIERIRKGDKEAIKEVYKEHSKEVYEFAKSITNDNNSALEATKRTFITLFSQIQSGQNPTNLRSTALKIAHDEACKIAMPSMEVVTSPYDESDTKEMSALDKAVGDSDQDQAMGETRVISLPKGAIDELDDDRSKATVDDVGRSEVFTGTQSMAPVPRDYRDNYKDDYRDDYRRRSRRDDYYDDYDDEYDDYDDDYYDDRPKERSGALFAVCLIINIIIIIILLWFVVGLLEHLTIIPKINLGYLWFNSHIADIF